jgi:hypothetical protein
MATAIVFKHCLPSFSFAVVSTNMDTALEQLRALITSYSIQYWHNLNNGIAILNALQALLKVAESRNSCCPSKYCSVSECQSEEGGGGVSAEDPRRDLKIVDVYSSSSHTGCEYMLKSLQQTAAEYYESDIENSDDNETVEELYQTADEGYDADAEAAAVTFNEPSESDENGVMHSAYCPASNFRNRVVYDNLCKIVVEILFDLSKRCLQESTFWPSLLTQLANRLAMVRDSIGGSNFLLAGFQPVLESNDVWLQGERSLKSITRFFCQIVFSIPYRFPENRFGADHRFEHTRVVCSLFFVVCVPKSTRRIVADPAHVPLVCQITAVH